MMGADGIIIRVFAGASFVWVLGAVSWIVGKLTVPWLPVPAQSDFWIAAIGFAVIGTSICALSAFFAIGAALFAHRGQ